MKNKKVTIFLIIILSLFAIAITVLMIKMINGKSRFLNFNFFSSVSDRLIFDETYNIDFDKINISSSSGNIYIKESLSNEVRVVVYADKDKLTVDTSNQNLNIDLKENNCIGFCFNVNLSKIEVYIPSYYSHLINIANDYGDIEIDSFKDATIDIDEDCGDVLVKSAGLIKVKNDYGNVKINSVNKADIYSSAGDVIINSVNDAVIKNDYGKIEIDNVSGYLDLSNDCGNIILGNVNLNKKSTIVDSYGNITIKEINDIYIDAKTDLGKVKINNNNHKSDIVLKIENDCGDIKVNN